MKMEVTREEIIGEAEETVDSTTDCEPSPVKKPKLDTKKAKMEAARGRAKALLSTCKKWYFICDVHLGGGIVACQTNVDMYNII